MSSSGIVGGGMLAYEGAMMSEKRLYYVRNPKVADAPKLSVVEQAVKDAGFLLPKESVIDPVLSGFIQQGELWVPVNPIADDFLSPFSGLTFSNLFRSAYPSMMFSSLPGVWDEAISEPPKVETPFELNLTEALIGWRMWDRNEAFSLLQSMYARNGKKKSAWNPDEPLTAKCDKGHEHECPAEFCDCGIYASTDADYLENYMDSEEGIIGQVYGWGRYVRGASGWRAQYAYPKSFHPSKELATPEVIELLKQYHVPIYVQQPMLIYNPEEDGYEYRDNEANWNIGAGAESDASEETDEDREAREG